ncbi:MAG TPA: TonB-dependent receptor plug domain-containing protein, partial [Sphingomicrobium sp.]
MAIAFAAQLQAAPATAPSATSSYPASFFASARPNTALDMIARLPGFTLDTGASVRGFAGAAGNVLIEGERPSTKADTLDNILRRIPATSVIRIDIIRGGAPGIDMQGHTVLANVILLRTART